MAPHRQALSWLRAFTLRTSTLLYIPRNGDAQITTTVQKQRTDRKHLKQVVLARVSSFETAPSGEPKAKRARRLH
jgi:hypothetical protein